MINKIYLIESIPDDENQTGTELFNDTIVRYNEYHKSNIQAELIIASSKSELIFALRNISEETQEKDELIIHIEAHGNDSEMGLKNDDRVSWNELTEYLIPINKLCKNKLHLNLVTCFSMFVGLSIKLQKTAPYKSYIATKSKVKPSEIIIDNSSLYEKIIKYKELYPAYVDFFSINSHSKFKIKDVETVIEFHIKLNVERFLQFGSPFLMKSFFDPYLNIDINLSELNRRNDKTNYIMELFIDRFTYKK